MSNGRRSRYAAAVLVPASGLAPGQPADRMELLDDALTRWTIENTSAGNFRMADGVLEVREPDGWLRSRRRYTDFELVVEFRFMTDDADSGIFVRATGDRAFRRGWPNQSYQVQLRNPMGESPFPPVGGLFRHGMASGPTDYDEDLARQSSLPTGEWQTLTVRVQDPEWGQTPFRFHSVWVRPLSG